MSNSYTLLILGIFLLLGGSLNAEKLKIACPHKEIHFTIEIPKTPKDQQKGLMFRETLAEDAGMLFLFSNPHTFSPAMWMKNTYIPLDMIFADKSGNVLEIFENTTPYSLDPIGPVDGTTQVLEINGGLAKKHGITKACTIEIE